MEGTKRSGGPRGGHVPLFFTRLHRCFASLSIDSGNGGKRGRERKGDGVTGISLRRAGWRFRFFRRFTFAGRKSPLIPSNALCMTEVLSSGIVALSCQSPGSEEYSVAETLFNLGWLWDERCGNVVHVFLVWRVLVEVIFQNCGNSL